MINLQTKPILDLSVQDIEELIHDKVPEGEQLEYKRTLPSKPSSPDDPWIRNQNEIGERAKREILEEVVAFANAHGGTLIVGVGESQTPVGVAGSIEPIPKCQPLADRLKLVFRDQVEPPIPSLEIRGVEFKEDGSGVLVIRTGKSRLAPHRVKSTMACTIRRQDRCEKLSMREIQDLTLNTNRGLERIESRFLERS